MEPKEATTLRQFLVEAFGGLDAPNASVERTSLFIQISWMLMLPFIFAPTGWAHITRAGNSHAPDVAWTLVGLWFSLAALCVLAGPLARLSPGPTGVRISVAMLLVGVLGTNQVSMMTEGTLASWGALYVAATIASYRVFLDYRTGLWATILGTLLLLVGVVLELTGWIPLAPFLEQPPVMQRYDVPGMALGTWLIGSVALWLMFGAVNYGMNQSHKLHRYITWSVLARYLPPALVERAASGSLRMDEPPQRRVCTVIFADLVGFTPMTERLGAAAVAEVLNQYLGEVSSVAHAHGATIDKFVGDGVMIVYGAPEPMAPEEQARKALVLCRALQQRLGNLPGEPLQMRIGLETGEGVVGNFGSQNRSDYTVIGLVANIAARLEAAGRPGRVLIGPGAAALLDDEGLEAQGPIALKGLSEPVQVFLA